ncbi:putative YigZ family protein [Melghirimyces profundicolus]|uniref:Putative YigZ family protein n=1 Tax=Melghirimyces profundicolus TaxID=1242148 RepID=A0A2T6C2M0_9BACL|nr:YigZ family protein [Melghirimyces profundicolus]PTX62560.1 putative YigZ family protein [Melghirimyces profundicolus]
MKRPSAYSTVKGYGEKEILIKKSRFITYVDRVETEEEATSFIRKISRQNWDATHNCHAYVVLDGSMVQKSSDDGEPAGTAGRPILEVINQRELVNTAVVVTRYFGGIKLGAGGLVRAYSQSAAAGLDEAGILHWTLHRALKITVDYPAMGKVEHELRLTDYDWEPPVFTDRVQWTVWVPVGDESAIRQMVAEITGGRGEIEPGRTEHRPRLRSTP